MPSAGEPSLASRVGVLVTVTNQATPIFTQSQYRVVVPENVPLHTAIASLEAHSPSSQKLIYSIADGNVYDEFSIDFNTGGSNCFIFDMISCSDIARKLKTGETVFWQDFVSLPIAVWIMCDLVCSCSFEQEVWLIHVRLAVTVIISVDLISKLCRKQM